MSAGQLCLLFLVLAVCAKFSGAWFQERYIVQPVNPVDSFDRRTWQNRYYLDNDSYTENGPIFVHVGGPDFYLADARMNMSYFVELGMEMGAVMAFTEHRFYGESRPTPNTSLANLQYLDTRYAIADLANLITELKAEYGDVPVMVHGYDQAGALAVWLKQRYPDLVDGAWVSSASLHARKDFGEYLVNIGNVIRSVGGSVCYQNTERAFQNLATYYDSGDFATIERYFKLCQPLKAGDMYQEAQLFAFHALALSEILRYSHAHGIETMCDFLDDYDDPMQGLANFIYMVLQVCVPLDAYDQLIQYTNVEWDTESTELGMRQLSYQLCREFGWFKASSYSNQPFGDRFPVDLFQDQCYLLFGAAFHAGSMPIMMDNTNRIFGGLTPNVTRVYFTDGDLDPAKTIGIQEPFGEEIYVDMIPNMAAGAEILLSFYAPNDDVRNVHNRVRELFTQWIDLAARK